MKLKQVPSQRMLKSVQVADITRTTKHKVHQHKGKGFKRWIGLPKPKDNSQFNPLDMVSNGILHKLAKEVDPILRKLERERKQQRRAEVIEYLKRRNG